MTKYIYNLSSRRVTEQNVVTLKEFLKLGDYQGELAYRNFAGCLKNFFNNTYIQTLAEQGKWMEIFRCWKNDYRNRESGNGSFYGNYPGWNLEFLLDFLYLSGIDFWSNLTTSDVMDINEMANTEIKWEEVEE